VCQVDCQESVYVECEQEMVEQCMTDCEDTGGAIFCDGQFVNADDAQSCADQVEASVSIEIDIEGAISAAADAVADTSEDVADTTSDTASCVDENVCSVTNVGAGRGMGTPLSLSTLGFALLWRLRRRKGSTRGATSPPFDGMAKGCVRES
jgi:MYXO-CTERM domain-containing protein